MTRRRICWRGCLGCGNALQQSGHTGKPAGADRRKSWQKHLRVIMLTFSLLRRFWSFQKSARSAGNMCPLAGWSHRLSRATSFASPGKCHLGGLRATDLCYAHGLVATCWWRLKSDYRYSIGLVYNTFPTPQEDADMSKLEALAQDVLMPVPHILTRHWPISMIPTSCRQTCAKRIGALTVRWTGYTAAKDSPPSVSV